MPEPEAIIVVLDLISMVPLMLVQEHGQKSADPEVYHLVLMQIHQLQLVTVSSFGTYVFSWTVANGTCTSSANVTVVFIQQPPAEAGSGGDECDKDFIMNAVITTGVGTWTKISGPGTAVFTPDNHQANAKVTVDQFGTYSFGWTVVNSICTSSDNVRVVFHDLPPINAGRDTAFCKGGSMQLHAQGVGTVSWIPADSGQQSEYNQSGRNTRYYNDVYC